MIYPKFMIRFLKNLTFKTHIIKNGIRGVYDTELSRSLARHQKRNRVCLRIVLSIISYIHYLLLSFLLAHGVISLRKRLLGSSIYQLKYVIYQLKKKRYYRFTTFESKKKVHVLKFLSTENALETERTCFRINSKTKKICLWTVAQRQL